MMFSITEVMTETINNEIVLALTLVCAGTNSQKPANSPHYHAAISGDDCDDEVVGNGDDDEALSYILGLPLLSEAVSAV